MNKTHTFTLSVVQPDESIDEGRLLIGTTCMRGGSIDSGKGGGVILMLMRCRHSAS